MYAVGGSADPTIFSEGNYFLASNIRFAKQVPTELDVHLIIGSELLETILVSDRETDNRVYICASWMTAGYQERDRCLEKLEMEVI